MAGYVVHCCLILLGSVGDMALKWQVEREGRVVGTQSNLSRLPNQLPSSFRCSLTGKANGSGRRVL